MTTYKVGDEVLVRAKVVRPDPEGSVRLRVKHYEFPLWEEHIHSLTPKPETDWTKVPMGARVRHATCGLGRFVNYINPPPKDGCSVGILFDDNNYTDYYAPEDCELVEEGDE